MHGSKSYNKCSKCSLLALTRARACCCHSWVVQRWTRPRQFLVCQVATVVMESHAASFNEHYIVNSPVLRLLFCLSVPCLVCLSVHPSVMHLSVIRQKNFCRIYLHHLIGHGCGLIVKNRCKNIHNCFPKGLFCSTFDQYLINDTRYGYNYNGRW